MFLLPAVAVVTALVVVVGLVAVAAPALGGQTCSPAGPGCYGSRRPVSFASWRCSTASERSPSWPSPRLPCSSSRPWISRSRACRSSRRGSDAPARTRWSDYRSPVGRRPCPVPAGAGPRVTTPDSTTAPGAPSTTLPCRNSTDPACGPFRWDPPPGPNQPVAIEITHSPSAPQVGEQVTVTVHVAEADSQIDGVTVSFGDEEVLTLPPASVVACDGAAPAGPWTPPRPPVTTPSPRTPTPTPDPATTRSTSTPRAPTSSMRPVPRAPTPAREPPPLRSTSAEGTADSRLSAGATHVEGLHGPADPTALVVQHALGVATATRLQPWLRVEADPRPPRVAGARTPSGRG